MNTNRFSFLAAPTSAPLRYPIAPASDPENMDEVKACGWWVAGAAGREHHRSPAEPGHGGNEKTYFTTKAANKKKTNSKLKVPV